MPPRPPRRPESCSPDVPPPAPLSLRKCRSLHHPDRARLAPAFTARTAPSGRQGNPTVVHGKHQTTKRPLNDLPTCYIDQADSQSANTPWHLRCGNQPEAICLRKVGSFNGRFFSVDVEILQSSQSLFYMARVITNCLQCSSNIPSDLS